VSVQGSAGPSPLSLPAAAFPANDALDGAPAASGCAASRVSFVSLPAASGCKACRLVSAAGSGAVLPLAGALASGNDFAAELEPLPGRCRSPHAAWWRRSSARCELRRRGFGGLARGPGDVGPALVSEAVLRAAAPRARRHRAGPRIAGRRFRLRSLASAATGNRAKRERHCYLTGYSAQQSLCE